MTPDIVVPDSASILIADDDPGAVRVLVNLLKDMARIHVTTRGAEAVPLALAIRPDLILLDIEMPDLDGFAVCQQVRSQPELHDALILFITSHGDAETESRALAAGAIDFIHKPVHADVVRARVRNYLAFKNQRDHLRRLSAVDALTGLANRRSFDATLGQEWARCGRSGEPIALLMCDVDDFKGYNDRYGHPAGDACLRSVAAVLGEFVRRPGDLAARYGGEEFVLLLPGCSAEDARTVAEGVLEALRALHLPHAGSSASPHVSLSIGACALTPGWTERGGAGGGTPEQLVRDADAALYAAKRGGRNRVEVAGA
jgi:diguanylate cyclase (GGDEF)-like protein